MNSFSNKDDDRNDDSDYGKDVDDEFNQKLL